MNSAPPKPTIPQRLRKTLFTVLKIAGICYVLLIVMLMLSENQMVYPAPKFPKGDWEPANNQFEEVTFQSADGTKLVGWYSHQENARGVVLFCHGNGENVAYAHNFVQRLHRDFQLSVLSFDYRGYGKSEGHPREEGICQDGRAAVEWLKARNEIGDRDIILMGRSLGGGVAVRLAAETDCRALVLINTFSSMPSAAATHYPLFPVGLLMRNRYPSIKRIVDCDQPLLQFHGDCDELAPLNQARLLFDASPADRKQFHVMSGCGHNSSMSDLFWTELEAFITELNPKS